jgi:ribosomal protein S18 acetylase RimI-like enzyme
VRQPTGLSNKSNDFIKNKNPCLVLLNKSIDNIEYRIYDKKMKENRMCNIRKMNIEDYMEIINLWKSTPGIGFSRNDDTKRSIKIFLEKNKNICFVAETEKEIIGTIMAGNDGRRGHIYHLTVKEEYRNNGIGKKLLGTVEKALKKEGIKKIFIVAFKKNKTGNKFWGKNGYEIRKDLNYRDRRIKE